jgi:hypothetical protein
MYQDTSMRIFFSPLSYIGRIRESGLRGYEGCSSFNGYPYRIGETITSNLSRAPGRAPEGFHEAVSIYTLYRPFSIISIWEE